MFKLDTNDIYEGKIQDGTYEVVINNGKEDATPNGAEYVELDLIVRNDVEQKYQNAHIFHKIWMSKQTNQYNPKSFNTIGKSLQLENGKEYNSINELLQDFSMKTCRVTVKNEQSEYNGKTYENTNVKAWQPSNVQGVLNHKFKKSDNDNNPINIEDDDLPF
ncbi:DUF669 domain-containing protein [Listeria fleischmannii]|uniref:DUF669 domain-containing protein n=1 Tax=Listeria fleischmannii TaxID=1069827 RepID=UPI0016293996|nr:DUF669 domain-containing protein [Listeria fleischmannii]MBC1420194.1 DUF669 domain-containing protein [Listeria fleischmannii]